MAVRTGFIKIASPGFYSLRFRPLWLFAKKFVVVFANLRRVVMDERHTLGQLRITLNRLLQPRHAITPSLVVVQAQADLGNVRMVVKELQHGTRGGSAKR